MDQTIAKFARHLLCLTLVLALSACTLPRSGPTKNEIAAGGIEQGGDVRIVQINDRVAEASRSIESLGFGSKFLNAGARLADLIARGDRLSVTVWENVDNGLLASVGQKVTLLEEVQVDQNGNIFIPYAGRLKAAGKTPDQLRVLVTRKLEEQTPDPQVEVRRLAGDGATVSILGGVTAQGVYPIEASTARLSQMLSRAGGVVLEPDVAQIRIQRGSAQGRIWLQDLYDKPSSNVALRSGDRIIVEKDRRVFTALGSTGTQTRVPFENKDMDLVEALATVGGLDANSADPTGIFVFRAEPSYVANRVTGRNDLNGTQKLAYVLDLTAPGAVFTAKNFLIRDGDTIYITQAPFVAWQKVLSAITGTISFAATTATAVNTLSN